MVWIHLGSVVVMEILVTLVVVGAWLVYVLGRRDKLP
jgi:hypothetical protein